MEDENGNDQQEAEYMYCNGGISHSGESSNDVSENEYIDEDNSGSDAGAGDNNNPLNIANHPEIVFINDEPNDMNIDVNMGNRPYAIVEEFNASLLGGGDGIAAAVTAAAAAIYQNDNGDNTSNVSSGSLSPLSPVSVVSNIVHGSAGPFTYENLDNYSMFGINVIQEVVPELVSSSHSLADIDSSLDNNMPLLTSASNTSIGRSADDFLSDDGMDADETMTNVDFLNDEEKTRQNTTFDLNNTSGSFGQGVQVNNADYSGPYSAEYNAEFVAEYTAEYNPEYNSEYSAENNAGVNAANNSEDDDVCIIEPPTPEIVEISDDEGPEGYNNANLNNQDLRARKDNIRIVEVPITEVVEISDDEDCEEYESFDYSNSNSPCDLGSRGNRDDDNDDDNTDAGTSSGGAAGGSRGASGQRSSQCNNRTRYEKYFGYYSSTINEKNRRQAEAKELAKEWNVVKEVMNRECGLARNRLSSLPGGMSYGFCAGFYSSRQTVQRMSLERSLSDNCGGSNTIDLHRSKNILICGGKDGRLTLLNCFNGKLLHDIRPDYFGTISDVTFVPNVNCIDIISTARDGKIFRSLISDGGKVENTLLYQHTTTVTKFVINPSNINEILSVDEVGYIYRKDMRMKNAFHDILNFWSAKERVPKYYIDHHPTAPEFCVIGDSNTVWLFDERYLSIDAMREVRPPFTRHESETFIAPVCTYNYCGNELLVCFSDDDIFLYDNTSFKTDGSCLHVYEGHRSIQNIGFFGLKSEYIISGSDCGKIMFYDKDTEQVVKCCDTGTMGSISCMKSHPEFPILFTCGLDNTINVWSPTANNEPSNSTSNPVFGSVYNQNCGARHSYLRMLLRHTINVRRQDSLLFYQSRAVWHPPGSH